MTERVNTEKVVGILDRLFEVPEGTFERLSLSGFTERQARAMVLFGEGESILEITKDITDGSTFTQNAYDALGAGVSKFLAAMLLVKELSENKELLAQILKRGLNYSRSFTLPYKNE